MKAMNFSSIALQAQLWLVRRSMVAILGVLLCIAGTGAWLWAMQHAKIQRVLEQPHSLAVVSSLVPMPTSPSDALNLTEFYDALGDEHYTEQQLKTLFALAAKNGLTLSKGQYTLAHEQNGRFFTYQIVLPVKGSYTSVWQFATQSLAAIPFSALDDISFKREMITDQNPEASLRFTLYLRSIGKKGQR